MTPVLRQDLLRSAPLLLPAGGALLFLLGMRLIASLVEPGWRLETAYPEWVLIGLGPLAWLIVRELGLREFTDGGHAAREHLPLRPARVFLEKALFGAAFLAALAIVGAMLLSTTLRLMRQADLELPEVLLRGGLAALAPLYGGLWLLASLGRHRWSAGAWGLVAALAAEAFTPFSWRELPPVRLVQDGLVGPEERLLASALLGLGLLVAASVPWWAGRGRLARAWSGPAGPREVHRASAAALVLVLAPALAGSRAAPPLLLEGRVAAEGPVRVRLDAEDPAASGPLAAAVASSLVPLGALGLEPPPVSIELARGQEGFLRARLRGRSGVLVRADFLDPGFDRAGFQAWVLRQALDAATGERLRAAPWRVLLDGWPAWREPGEPQTRERARLRAAWAVRALGELPGPGLFLRWDEARARVGEELAGELAGWIVAELERRAGPEAPSRVVRELVAARTGPLAALSGPASLERAFASGAGVSLRAFEEQLALAARELVAAEEERLRSLVPPANEGHRLEPVRRADGTWLRLLVPPGDAGGEPATLWYAAVPAEAEGPPGEWDRAELLPGPEPLEVGPFAPGVAVWATWARACPPLGLPLISGWRRVDPP